MTVKPGPSMLKLNKRQRRCLQGALMIAIDSELALVDAYTSTWAKRRRSGAPYKIIAPKDRPLIQIIKNRIRNYRELDALLGLVVKP